MPFYSVLFLVVALVVGYLSATGLIGFTLGLGPLLFYAMLVVFMGAIVSSAFKDRPDEDAIIVRRVNRLG